ncbi:nicotinamide mononucleotide deamidase-related protein [Metallosphaera cuprina]|uniref:Competence damage-inducible protein A n=1 Tax=Metallosphaera cuprina (strain Ar-4) TaxID=1006006 RepID=F4FYF7_METCR|nr:nicotinamide mononucleotide deamidase-related protein [Metallosphaera cuprina]AEB94276.1 competence damage-inducible protein A [Metallosphaera cuprina Ar-4]
MHTVYKAEILSVGNELLSGRTINTNSAYIAQRLTILGYSVRRITTIGDNLEDISLVIKEIIERKPKLLVITGGLGPTYDDITVEGLAKALNLKTIINEDALNELKEKYMKRGLELTQERIKMAILPEGALSVKNTQGIAPGFMLKYNETVILVTPGVPKEMEAVLDYFINNLLNEKPPIHYYEESFLVKGVMESELAPHIKKMVKEYDIYIKTHPKGHETKDPFLEIQVVSSGLNKDETLNRVKDTIARLKTIVKQLNGVIID